MYRVQYYWHMDKWWGAWYPMNEAGAKHLDKAFRLGVVHDVEFKLV